MKKIVVFGVIIFLFCGFIVFSMISNKVADTNEYLVFDSVTNNHGELEYDNINTFISTVSYEKNIINRKKLSGTLLFNNSVGYKNSLFFTGKQYSKTEFGDFDSIVLEINKNTLEKKQYVIDGSTIYSNHIIADENFIYVYSIKDMDSIILSKINRETGEINDIEIKANIDFYKDYPFENFPSKEIRLSIISNKIYLSNLYEIIEVDLNNLDIVSRTKTNININFDNGSTNDTISTVTSIDGKEYIMYWNSKDKKYVLYDYSSGKLSIVKKNLKELNEYSLQFFGNVYDDNSFLIPEVVFNQKLDKNILVLNNNNFKKIDLGINNLKNYVVIKDSISFLSYKKNIVKIENYKTNDIINGKIIKTKNSFEFEIPRLKIGDSYTNRKIVGFFAK